MVSTTVTESIKSQISPLNEATNGTQELQAGLYTVTEPDAVFEFLFLLADDGIMVTDLEGKVREANDAALRMLGVSSIDELGSAYEMPLIRPGEDEKNLITMVENGRARNIERQFIHRDGHTVYTELNITVRKDSSYKPGGFLIFMADATAKNEWRKLLMA